MDLKGLVLVLVGFINTLIPVLASIALALFLWGTARFIYRSGSSEGHGHDRDMITWGLVALFILFSLWGIIGLLQNTLLPGGSSQGSAPVRQAPPATLSI